MSHHKGNHYKGRLLATLVLCGIASAIAAAVVTALLINIFEHKQEGKQPFFQVVDVDDNTTDPAVWGKNFPLQYDLYKSTVDMQRTRYGGSESLPQTPTEADPRSVVAQSKLQHDPRLVKMWKGYAFSVDFREERGHAYMLIDQTYTERQEAAPQAGTCINCHASTYVPMKKLGEGDIFKGFEKLNGMTYAEARKHVEHPVACIDCHDPDGMQLRITRPAFIEGIAAYKAYKGDSDYDVNRDASRQEMRTYVCAQCHVEYYFKGEEKRLTFPWTHGLRGDDALAYYDEVGFSDWTHKLTGAPVLKAQHPEFEMWKQGIHAQNGVMCADCHMPYVRAGAMKISNHHVRSPLLDVNAACQTCHRSSEEEILAKAHRIQDRHAQMRNVALDALMELIDAIEAASENGAGDGELAAARNSQRSAQFLLGWVEAENSMGFHADQEAARLMVLSLDHTRKGMMQIPSTPTAGTE